MSGRPLLLIIIAASAIFLVLLLFSPFLPSSTPSFRKSNQRVKFLKSNRHAEANQLELVNAEQIKKMKLITEAHNLKSAYKYIKTGDLSNKINPFRLVKAYEPLITNEFFNNFNEDNTTTRYNLSNLGLINDERYCDTVDIYNLFHSTRLFKKLDFMTDYTKDTIFRHKVLEKFGNNMMPFISNDMNSTERSMAIYPFNTKINLFYTGLPTFHYYHQINSDFLCVTQMYNHIPGSASLKRQDLLANELQAYIHKNAEHKHCFKQGDYFPVTYRLWVEEECKAFWKDVNSKEFKKRSQNSTIQYIIKNVDKDTTSLFDKTKQTHLRKIYGKNAQNCGEVQKKLIVNKHITNPLLLDKGNKFHLKTYLLISSTNPMIAYYHDGFILPSLVKYNPKSTSENVHFISEKINKAVFKKALKKLFKGTSKKDLIEYQTWSIEKFVNYLLEKDIIQNETWFQDELRPKLQTALIHLVRMSKSSFFTHSGVFEFFAVDFIIDEELEPYIVNVETSMTMKNLSQKKQNYMIKMFDDGLKIQFSYYKSRMNRILSLMKSMYLETKFTSGTIKSKWASGFAFKNENRMSLLYTPSPTNTWIKIIDKTSKGTKVYNGLLKYSCIFSSS